MGQSNPNTGQFLARIEASMYGKLEAVASRRSASQTLITDCRVTPSLLASRSGESIIQVGKSTFTRFCTCSVDADRKLTHL